YDVTVYERKSMAGGLDTYGMAEYKMSQAVSQAEVDQVAKLGVKFLLNTEVSTGSVSPAKTGELKWPIEKETPAASETLALQSVAFSDLQQWHDAVFLGVGLGDTNKLGIPGEDLEGVYDALKFIERIKARDWKSVPLGNTVAVVGAGNTAIDAVTQAKRLGAARVIMVYRRGEKDIPAYAYEYELAKKDGVEFIWQSAPIGILSDEANQKVTALRCEKSDGSLQIFEIPCDMIIKAVGQQKMRSFFESVAGVKTDEKGRVIVNDSMQTSNAKVFAGGDCANGGAEAVDASQMGKLAAQAIHESLTGEQIGFAGSRVPEIQTNENRH
ncbi:MAG TPA: FAD-dependent oxidoreductase, partial [Pyrinomonadaceae bacterium]|nr:FAD-dependent oxidoreductase [Pyrinomonadaceae bacterium]